MPHYFFDVEDGASMRDEEGVALACHDAARQEALRAAGSMLRDYPDFASGETWKMIVRDETGAVLSTLSFKMS